MTAPVQEFQTQRFAKWWKDLGLRKLLAWQATILISQMTTDYDESVVGSFQSMKPWVKGPSLICAIFETEADYTTLSPDMGYPDSSRVGLITSIVFVGGFVGALVASPTADYFGRRVGMFVGSTLTFVGTIIQTAAQNVGMFIGGRFLIGFGISFTCVAGPSLLFELAYPAMRGTISSLVREPLTNIFELFTMLSAELIFFFLVQCTLVRRLHHCGMDDVRHGIHVYQLVMAYTVAYPRSSRTVCHDVCSLWSTRKFAMALFKPACRRSPTTACKISQQRQLALGSCDP